MSYQVIARKWRPQTFDEVTGQEHITRTLRNAIEHDRLHHAYLFSGARGVGKTTTARLLAKALNCHKSDKPTVTPCKFGDPDACASCTEIAEGRSIDVLEFDAASNTQVDKIRDLIIENITTSAARDRYRVFIIDEVHMLSTSSFNALLKTLEEPPPNVMFIMATTELHKVPDTIVSRTQQFEFRTIPLQKIYERLRLIADSEKVKVSDDALREIARSGDGSMRDAQSNFDQVISFSDGSIDVADVVDALGLASSEMLRRILRAIADKDAAGPLAVVEELSSRGQDFRNFCRDLLGIFRDLLVAKVGGVEAAESSTLTPDDLSTFAAEFGESDLVRFFNSLAATESSLRDAAQPRYMLEIGLVKLIEMRRLVAIEDVIARLARLESAISSDGAAQAATAASTPAPAAEEKKTLNNAAAPAPIATAAAAAAPAPAQPAPKTPEPEPTAAAKPEAPPQTAASPILTAEFLNTVPVRLPPIASEDLEHIDDQWLDDAYELKLLRSGDALAPIAGAEAMVIHLVGRQSSNGVDEHAPADHVQTAAARSVIPDFDTLTSDTDAPAELPRLSDAPTRDELLAFAQAHPKIRQVMRVFRGKIVDVTRS
ncbi:MAG: DNA polymerase III subunit gamma/tau [Pyrinomonadaceae bacterium]